MIRVVAILAVLALAVSCLVECVQTDRRQVRYLPKALWLFLILIPVLGPTAWFVAGRPRTAGGPDGGRTPARRPLAGPRAPDDDLDFLAKLDADRRLAAWEREIAPRDETAREDAAETDEDPEPRGDSGS